MKREKQKDNDLGKVYQTRRRKSVSDSWIPEKNATTEFTVRGMVMLLILIGLLAVIKFTFF